MVARPNPQWKPNQEHGDRKRDDDGSGGARCFGRTVGRGYLVPPRWAREPQKAKRPLWGRLLEASYRSGLSAQARILLVGQGVAFATDIATPIAGFRFAATQALPQIRLRLSTGSGPNLNGPEGGPISTGSARPVHVCQAHSPLLGALPRLGGRSCPTDPRRRPTQHGI